MRVFWLSPTPGLLNESEGTGGYGGSGWVGALQHLFLSAHEDNTLGIAFPHNTESKPIVKNDVHYYPILKKRKSGLQKLLHYYGGYKQIDYDEYVSGVHEAINDFHPDVIHLFGIENPFATILGHCDIPVVVHLQGLLCPYDNAFFPIDINSSSFVWPPSVREWVWRNGYQFAKKELHVQALREAKLIKQAHCFMGRTQFDYQYSQFMSPSSIYYKVNEALRPPFYLHAGEWKHTEQKFVISSTISETVYKGLDLILKTAKLLKNETNINFEWQVVGINETSKFVKFFEHFLSIQSSEVNVRYLGVLSSEELVKQNLSSSVYVHPSYIDNSPNSVCEAQMLGMPVIATNVGGVSSLIEHQKDGLLVPANAPYELAYWIKKLHDDSSFAIMLGHHASETAALRHDKETIVKDLFAAYHSIIDNCHE